MLHSFLPAGELSRLVILGLGQLTPVATGWALEHGLDVRVFTSLRQQDVELLGGGRVADSLGVPLTVIDNLRQVYYLANGGAVLLSFGSPWIIPQALVDCYGGRAINSHGAPLPEWRGGGGFSWRILAGDRRGRTCFHLVTPEIDAGDIIWEHSYEFPAEARYPRDYMAHAVDRARWGLVEVLEGILAGRDFELRPQDEAHATYFPRLDTDANGWIDWSWMGWYVEHFVLAFSHPYPGAQTFSGGQEVRIFNCRFSADGRHPHPFFHGLVYRSHEGRHHVACRGGTLAIGQEDITVPLKIGDRLFTPAASLEGAMRTRHRL